MGKSDAAVQVTSNVTITVLNRNNEPIQVVKKHNKATVLMVEGLLRFLQGWYSSTEYNKALGGGTPEDSIMYVPTKLGFGNIGVNTVIESKYSKNPMFNNVNSGDFVEPTFNSTRLQRPLIKWSNKTDQVGYESFSDSEITSYEDLNNSESLRLITKITPGQLVGEYLTQRDSDNIIFKPYEKSFYDPEIKQWCSMITEIGLFSSHGALLARVLLDSPVKQKTISNESGIIGYSYEFENPDSLNNPIVQTQETTLVIEWRIGLISVSDRDQFITQNNIKYQDLAKIISSQVTSTSTSEEIEKMILDVLSGYDDITTSSI